jgi:hypothetical protein
VLAAAMLSMAAPKATANLRSSRMDISYFRFQMRVVLERKRASEIG